MKHIGFISVFLGVVFLGSLKTTLSFTVYIYISHFADFANFFVLFHAVVAMDSTVANDWRSWGGELETGLAKDHELGLEHNYLHRVKNIMLLYTHRDHIYGYNDFYACQIRGNFFPQNTSLAVLHFFFFTWWPFPSYCGLAIKHSDQSGSNHKTV